MHCYIYMLHNIFFIPWILNLYTLGSVCCVSSSNTSCPLLFQVFTHAHSNTSRCAFSRHDILCTSCLSAMGEWIQKDCTTVSKCDRSVLMRSDYRRAVMHKAIGSWILCFTLFVGTQISGLVGQNCKTTRPFFIGSYKCK